MTKLTKMPSGTAKPLINFVHANGFPAGSYQTFLNYFTESYDVVAQEKYGHNPNFPIHHGWQYLVDELIHYLKQQNQPVICIGHSFGGVISYLAACKQPSLFKGLIMLDPPAMTGVLGWVFKLFKNTAYIDKITPAGKAKIRRSHWPADTDLAKLFKHRQLFKNFDARCLKDYTNSAMALRNDRLELTFDAQAETEIFRNIPTHLSSLRSKLTVPAALIYGESSDLYPSYFFKRFAKQNKQVSLHTIAGGHMFPLESPEKTSILINDIINQWQL